MEEKKRYHSKWIYNMPEVGKGLLKEKRGVASGVIKCFETSIRKVGKTLRNWKNKRKEQGLWFFVSDRKGENLVEVGERLKGRGMGVQF